MPLLSTRSDRHGVSARRFAAPRWRRLRLATVILLAAAAPLSAQQAPSGTGATSGSATAGAQPVGSPSPRTSSRNAALTARYHVRQMENVLERAVQHAADMMRRRLQAVTPDVLALAGTPRAQGFRIDGYGLFFSVEVPRLSESVNWALRVLSQDSDERVLASLRKVATSEQDPVLRADLERAMRTIQMQLASMAGPGPAAGSASAARRGAAPAPASTPAAPVAAAAVTSPVPPAGTGTGDHAVPVGSAEAAGVPSVGSASVPTQVATLSSGPLVAPPEQPATAAGMGDPSVAYEDEVKQALVDAMLDYAGSLPLPPVEWVTVAARDAGYVAFPDAVSDMVTVTLSVRVSDLIEFRAQRLTREDARTRVVIREF